ncbi:MAG TPA: TonB-dependent receptor, partial [Flavihumibacter sp.]
LLYVIPLYFFLIPSHIKAQDKNQSSFSKDSIFSVEELGEVVFSFSKWQQNRKDVPGKITRINARQIQFQQPQTAADMLAQSGSVFIQKSQLGGGSPMIRGFATNRVLLVVDGVRMNNAIYRSGNLQNVISIDPLSLDAAEVIFGPGSLVYGSDAIGGVMNFQSLEAKLSKEDHWLVKGSAQARYSSANHENTIHADLNLAGKKFSSLSSLTYSKFDDLRMGKHGGQDSYLRPEYVIRINDRDSIFRNSDPRTQRFSGYEQWNLLQKLRYQINDRMDLQYGFTYGGTGTHPRYDRLIQYRSGQLRFAEWNYGPMLWRMHNLRFQHSGSTALYDNLRLTLAYQNYTESRIDRTVNRSSRNTQTEDVDAISANLDAMKSVGRGALYWGAEYVYNKVGSQGSVTDILTGEREESVSRYPDNSKWHSSGIYASYTLPLTEKWQLLSGIRYSLNGLKARFHDRFIPFPYDQASINKGSLTFNLGTVYQLSENWHLNAHVSSGYRMPNIDDIGKLFESSPGNLTVPNPGLEPEYAWNMELGLARSFPPASSGGTAGRFELTGFYTLLDNAIVLRPDQFNGQDSIVFDGVRSRVYSLQNVANATVWGLQAAALVPLNRWWLIRANANFTRGRETDDAIGSDRKVPLRHAPPFFGNLAARYGRTKWMLEANLVYNSAIKADKLAPSEQSKTDIYARDKNGRPYSPDWYTLNLKGSWQVIPTLQLSLGWENITNQRYRPYSSGIVAAGSNLIASLRASF